MRSIRHLAQFALVAIMLLLVLIPSPPAFAARASWCDASVIGGRTQCFGYFENQDAYVKGKGISLDDVILGGLGSYAKGNVNTLAKFIAFYNNKLYGGSANDQMGAAFVILTMLGVQGPDAGGSVANGIATAKARFNEWKAVVLGYDGSVKGYGVDLNYTYTTPKNYANSARSRFTNDVVYHYRAAESITVVRFYTPSGTVATIERSCSNMIGTTGKMGSNYDLYPGINGTAGSYAPVPLMTSGTILLGAEVDNTASAADRDSPYEVHEFVVPAGTPRPDFGTVFTSVQGQYRYTTADHANNTACNTWLSGTFAGKITSCTLKESGTTTFPAGIKRLNTYAIDANAYNPGDWVCRFMSVGLYKYDVAAGSLTHRVSQPICAVIAKQPTVQVWGDDVKVGDNYLGTLLNNKSSVLTAKFNAKNSDGVQATFGSWVEYGIFAPAPNGVVSSISGGAAAGTKGNTLDLIANPASANGLTFANTDSGNYGKWAAANQIDSLETFVTSRYTEGNARSDAVVQLESLNVAGGVQDGDIKIIRLTNAAETQLKGSLTSNGTAILISDQTVHITGNITIQNDKKTMTKLGYGAQVIIIAKNIVIDEGVTNIDSWLVARPTDPAEALDGPNGKISTCGGIQAAGNYTNGLKMGVCNSPLRINGAVMAKEVQLRRTFGADKTTGFYTPAEVINLRADAYMWARSSADSAGTLPITTITTTELPPRF